MTGVMAETIQSSAKRVKLMELPMSGIQRTAITNTLNKFKKRGSFDSLRRAVLAKFENSQSQAELRESLNAFAQQRVDEDEMLLSKDRRQAAPLIEGAAERQGIYKSAEAAVQEIIGMLTVDAGDDLHRIRRQDIGEEKAAAEMRSGRRSEAEYRKDSDARQKIRDRKRQEERRTARARELEQLKKRAAELEKEREEHAKREAEREAKKKVEEERKKELEREAAERLERKKRQDAEWAAEQRAKEEQERKKRELEREQRIEKEALEELIMEGKRAAARSSRVSLVDAVPSPRRDHASSAPPRKESAMEAIMRREKMENERAKQHGLERLDSTTSRRLIAPRPSQGGSSLGDGSSKTVGSPPVTIDAPRATSKASPLPADDHRSRHTEDRDKDRDRGRQVDDRHRSNHRSGSGRRSSRYEDENSDHERDRIERHGRYDREREYDRHRNRDRDRDRDRDRRRYRDDSADSYDRGHRPRDYRSSRDAYDYDRDRDRDRDRSRDYYRASRRHDSRSRTPPRRREDRDRDWERPRDGDRDRANDRERRDSQRAAGLDDKSTPVEIDRYVPSTSVRAVNPFDSSKTRIYDRAAEEHERHRRGGYRDRERDLDRDRERGKDRSRSRSRKRRRSRSSSRRR